MFCCMSVRMGFIAVATNEDPQVRKLFKAIQALREKEEEEQANEEANDDADEEQDDDESEQEQDGEDDDDDDEPDAQAELALDAAYGEEDGDAQDQEPEAKNVGQRGRSEPELDSQQDAQVVKTPDGQLLRRTRSKKNVDRLASNSSYVGKLLTKEEEELAKMLEEIRLMEGHLGYGNS